MRKRFSHICLVIGLIIAAITFLFLKKDLSPNSNTRLVAKHEPSDQFFRQRAFPDDFVNLAAYTKALEIAQISAKSRSRFDNFPNQWQVEGPGNLGARVNTIATHPNNDQIIFAGYSAGGIYRTMDGGATWTPVFDDQLFLAISDLVFDSQDANTIYAGTGDTNISGFPFLGDGLYKSTDLGETWEYIGLEEQRIISKILVHPTNNQTLYVGSMGFPFEPNDQKGLYKTTDGGKNWEQILFLGGITGVIDVVFDQNNPNILYAAGWDRLRNNRISETSGQGAKIYKSVDGGESWEQLTGGLPQSDQSRIGLATTSEGVIAVYTNPDHQFEGLFSTVDDGASWQKIPTDDDTSGFNTALFGGFGWYFSKVRVNPKNDQDITVLGVSAYRTVDGGETWAKIQENAGINVHVDAHDLAYTANGELVLGTDGGMYQFAEDGTKGRDIENIATTQVYRTAYNPHEPSHYYGGFQDNGTAFGNNSTITDWNKFYGGDGFQMAFHPTNPDIFYAESQRGNIGVTLDKGQTWSSAVDGIESNDRKNWDMQYFLSPHNPDVLYTGTHRVYRSTVGPLPKWEIISPDLTNGPTEELRQTISTLDQSPVNPNLLYAATTDGNIWRSINEGNDWEQLTGLPERYFTEVVASPTKENTVFTTLSGYRDNDNTPHIFKSTDGGLIWQPINGNLPPLAINCLQVIPNTEDQVLFVGTDGGVYGSLDGGQIWERVGTGMPIIAVYDLAWNQKENTLIAGTFGRSVQSYSLEGIVAGANTSSVTNQRQVENALTIFPNPVVNDLTLAFFHEKNNHPVQISIYDMSGRLMKTATRRTAKEVRWIVSVNDLPDGPYLVTVKGDYFQFTERFIKNDLR
ncbi:MAG: T9SS type A sorting domain-containing protein [Bacteroidota bacterium]